MSSKQPGATVAHRRALVTGGTGFIGTQLCRRLADLGAEVNVASRRSGQINPGQAWVEMDVCEPRAVSAAFAEVQPEIVFHLAGLVTGSRAVEHVEPTLRTNLLAAVNVLAAAQEVGAARIVLAGSMEAPPSVSPESPSSPYAASKWAAEGYARMFHRIYRCPVVTLRVFMVYGPGPQDETKLVPYVIRSLLAGQDPKVSSGSRMVDWVYVDDVVDAFVAAAQADGVDGGVFDVGSGEAVTIRAVVERLVELFGSPGTPMFGALPDRPLETSNVADVAKTTEALGWVPKTGLDEGLRLTRDWFRARVAVELPPART